MGRRDQGRGAPSSERDELKRAFLLVAADSNARPKIGFRYLLDLIERRYAQPPGSSRTWDVEDLMRAIEYYRLENAPSKRKVS